MEAENVARDRWAKDSLVRSYKMLRREKMAGALMAVAVT